MQTIVVASNKGGAGKTTLVTHLAVEAHRQNAGPVGVIDADPMGGASGWYNARDPAAKQPVFLEIGQGGLSVTLQAAEREGFHTVLIDTPPAATDAIQAIMQLSDLVVVPVIPSPNDLRAIGDTLELVENSGRPFVFVLNNADPRALLTGAATRLLSQNGPIAATLINHRQIYRSAMTDGRVAAEVRGSGAKQAAAEMAALWTDIASTLKSGGNRRGAKGR